MTTFKILRISDERFALIEIKSNLTMAILYSEGFGSEFLFKSIEKDRVYSEDELNEISILLHRLNLREC